MTTLSERLSRLMRGIHGEPYIPQGEFHWIDTTPVDSTDKPCTVQSLEVQAHVCGIYAEVTQTIEIENPNHRPLSTSLAIPLPDRAVVCGYALDINGQLVDGVVVPKEEARVVFETEQRRGADPGLVEAVRGNAYRTRVYPVPRNGMRTVRLSYVAPLILQADGSATLDLSMPNEHLSRRNVRIDIEDLDGTAPQVTGLPGASFTQVWSGWSLQAEDNDITPDGPVRMSVPHLPAEFTLLERDDEGTTWFCASRMAAEDDATNDVPALTELTVLWDASGSREVQNHERELELLRTYASVDTITQLRLITFADSAREAIEFSTADELIAHLAELHYDGGTNLGALSQELARVELVADVENGSACLLFSDGLDTLDDKPFELPRGIDVLSIVSSGERDVEALRQGTRGPVFDLEQAPNDLAGFVTSLLHARKRGMGAVSGSGIADVCDVSSPGGERLAVIGRLTGQEASLKLGTDAPAITLRADDARDGKVLARAWAARRVSLLSPRASEHADELLALGRRYGVVSPATSLLVLETLDQWLRYEIEPPLTLTQMHDEWKRIMQGRMRHTSDEERKNQHREQLVRSWGQFMDWWKRDYSTSTRPTEDDRPRPTGRPMAYVADSYEEEGLADYIASEEPEPRSARRRSVRSYSAPTSAPESAMRESFRGPSRMMAAAAPLAAAAAPLAAAAMNATEAPRMADDSETAAPSMQVSIKPWSPDAPYLKALDRARSEDQQTARNAYYGQRGEYHTSPSFFLDCATWFLAAGDDDFGITVLSNLAEMRIEDAALLRVMAWRLREAGRLERALVVLRRIQSLRNEDSQSHRDLALVLGELAREAYACGKEAKARAYAEEAAKLYHKVAFTPWQRRAMAIGLFAVEEYNVLRAWAQAQTWTVAPEMPSLGEDLEGVPDCDLRITLAWDADETDVDIHVTEPSGEEAYYGHRLTYAGGRVSEDITDGYGPEQYSIRKARAGVYLIRAHYYASHQQTMFGPATCTLTVYTDWGRAAQAQTITTTRLDRAHEMTTVGTASYGDAVVTDNVTGTRAEPTDPTEGQRRLEVGMTQEQVKDILGEPTQSGSEGNQEVMLWELRGGREILALFVDDKLSRVIERMSWGDEMVVVE